MNIINPNLMRPLSPHLTRLRQFLYSVLIILTFLIVSYSLLRLIDVNGYIFWLKVQWTIFSKSLYFLFSRLGLAGTFFSFVFYMLMWDLESVGNTNMMPHHGGASSSAHEGASSPAHSEASVNQAPPAEAPQVPAPQEPNTVELFVKAQKKLGNKLRHLFDEENCPMKDKSSIHDIVDRVLNSSTDLDTINGVIHDLNEKGRNSPFFVIAKEAKEAIDLQFYLEEGFTSSSSDSDN